MSEPRIAVLMPCFNEGELLLESVASVQEPQPVEIVVIDDCSTEPATHALLDRLERDGVTVLRLEENGGPGAARTAGLRATAAEYVFSLDADDLLEPGMLTRLAALLDENPGAGVAYGDHQEFGDGEVLRRAPATIDPFRLLYVFEYPPAALFRRAVLERLDGWDAGNVRLPAYEDWHLWLKLAGHGVEGIHVGEGVITYRRRLHGNRLLTRARRQHRSLYRTLRRLHPTLFARKAQLRRESGLSAKRKLLYPVVYGGRPKLAFEHKLRVALERRGIRISGG